jgi:lipoate-protein ligase A
MNLLDLTLANPAENIALDEALLEEAEASTEPLETLRLWESRTPLVVVGRSSKPEEEVRLDYCREHRIPVLRRASGGAAIVAGPGCLMYAVVLSLELRPALRSLDETHRSVLETMVRATHPFAEGVARYGTSDLAWNSAESPPQKFSGNSVRLKRRHVLYHGTLLYDFPLALVGNCLAFAPRQPAYRAGRDHRAFVQNLPVDVTSLRKSVASAWQATSPRTTWPQSRVQSLIAEKYANPEWNVLVV